MKFLNASETKFHYGLNNLSQPAVWMGIDPNQVRDNWTFSVDEDGRVIFAVGEEQNEFITIDITGIIPVEDLEEVLDLGSDARPFKDLYLSDSVNLTKDTSTIIIDGKQILKEQQNNILSPSGGATIDTQARSVITAILNMLRQHGLIATP